MIYVFTLRVYLKIAGRLECVWDDGIDVEAGHYDDAVKLAKKAFVEKHPPLKGFTDFDKIEVLYHEFA